MYTLQASTVISIHFKTYVYQFIEKATEQFLIMVEVQGSGALNEKQNLPPLLAALPQNFISPIDRGPFET